VKFAWFRSLLIPLTAALVGLVLWPFADMKWGLAVLILGLAWALGAHLMNFKDLMHWLRDPLRTTVPMGRGVWEEAFAALHRMTRGTLQHQHRLTSQLARFRSAGHAMPDGVVVLDAEDRIAWCNAVAGRWFGLDTKKDIGQPILNLVRNPDFVVYVKGGHFDEPLLLRTARQPDLVLSLRVVPYGHEEKLLLSRDVTQAEKLEIMRRDFVANVSHELKTPLTVVSGFLETIVDGTVDPREPRGKQALEMMRGQTDRMLHLIDYLLRLSALEASSMPAHETTIDVAALMHGASEDAKALSSGRHGVRLQSGPALKLYGDEGEIRSAVGNLVTNAVRYTPKEGRIVLSWELRDGECWISVQDSGIGVERRHIPRLTERFYRVDTSRSRETGGTGLGLAIVKHVMTRHQGRLEIDSEPGSGSTFSIVFPASRVDPQATRIAS
jgi:two-component system, OmpR family, phosphate regulon sensor histidine kinase PhoR